MIFVNMTFRTAMILVRVARETQPPQKKQCPRKRRKHAR